MKCTFNNNVHLTAWYLFGMTSKSNYVVYGTLYYLGIVDIKTRVAKKNLTHLQPEPEEKMVASAELQVRRHVVDNSESLMLVLVES